MNASSKTSSNIHPSVEGTKKKRNRRKKKNAQQSAPSTGYDISSMISSALSPNPPPKPPQKKKVKFPFLNPPPFSSPAAPPSPLSATAPKFVLKSKSKSPSTLKKKILNHRVSLMTLSVLSTPHRYSITTLGEEGVADELGSLSEALITVKERLKVQPGSDVTLTCKPDRCVTLTPVVDTESEVNNGIAKTTTSDIMDLFEDKGCLDVTQSNPSNGVFVLLFPTRISASRILPSPPTPSLITINSLPYTPSMLTLYKPGVLEVTKYVTEYMEDEDEREEIEDELSSILGAWGEGELHISYGTEEGLGEEGREGGESSKPDWVPTPPTLFAVYYRYCSSSSAYAARSHLNNSVVAGAVVKANVIEGSRGYGEMKGVKKFDDDGYEGTSVSEEVQGMIREVLTRLQGFDRKRKEQGKGKVRLRMGFREIERGLRANRCCLVVLANNLEGGEVEKHVESIINEADDKGVPVVRSWNARKVGRIVGKNVKVSVVGVESVEGVEGEWKKIKKIITK